MFSPENLPIINSERLRKFIKLTEGCILVQKTRGSFKNGLFFPYKSAEGGTKTIGYGHKLSLEEERNNIFKNGIGEPLAESLLSIDLNKAINVAKSILGESWRELDLARKEIATEYSFNLGYGFNQFIKFITALIHNDYNGMQREYKRFFKDYKGSVHELTERNKLFFDTYLRVNGRKQEKDNRHGLPGSY